MNDERGIQLLSWDSIEFYKLGEWPSPSIFGYAKGNHSKTMEQERKLPGTEQESKPDNKPSGETPAPEFDEVDSEIDQHLKEAPEDLTGEESDDGETVTLKKSDLEKYKTKTNNVLNGLKTVKVKVKSLRDKAKPSPAPQDQEHKQQSSSSGQQDASEFVTKKELYRENEKAAIKTAETDSVLSDNWNEVMQHFSGRRGRGSKEAILSDINDAFILWQQDNPEKAKKAGITGTRKLQVDLASDTNKPAGDSSNGQTAQTPRKSVLPKKAKASDWYSKPDKK